MKNAHLIIVLIVITFIAGGLLIGKQNLNNILPLFLTLLCPLSMLFMMGRYNHNNKLTKGGVTMEEVKTVYTCPMHPGVTLDKPGSCPKCGMFLVEKNSKKEDTK